MSTLALLWCHTVWCVSAIGVGVLGRTLDVLNMTLSVPWASQGWHTGLVVLQCVTWGQRDKTCHRRNSSPKLWIGNGRQCWYTPARLHQHSLGEAGWGKLPKGCSTSLCLSLASLDIRSISTFQTSTLRGSIWGLVWKSRLGYSNTEPWHLCTLALNAQFGVLKDL